MASYELTDVGSQILTAGTTALFMAVNTKGRDTRQGRAFPPNLYDVALLRFGKEGYVYPSFAIDADNQVVDVPAGATTLYWSCLAGAVVDVSEDVVITPPGAAISTDVGSGEIAVGQFITITWEGVDDALVDDLLTVTQDTWDDPGGSYNYLVDGWFYTSSGTQTVGSTPSTAGTKTVQLSSPFPDQADYLPKVSTARIYRGGVAPAVLTSVAFTMINPP